MSHLSQTSKEIVGTSKTNVSTEDCRRLPDFHLSICAWSKRTQSENEADLLERKELGTFGSVLIPTMVADHQSKNNTTERWTPVLDACKMPSAFRIQVPLQHSLRMGIVINGVNGTSHPTQIISISFCYAYGSGTGGSCPFFDSRIGRFQYLVEHPSQWHDWMVLYLSQHMDVTNPSTILTLCQTLGLPVAHYHVHQPCRCLSIRSLATQLGSSSSSSACS